MLIMRGFLAGLVTATAVQAQSTITDDSYFFGQSPPIYPSPNTTGTGKWAGAYAKAVTMVGQMTLEEKVSLTSGVSSNTSCVGVIPAIERLGFTGICVSDAGQGLRSEELVSSWPSGVHAGASWNRELSGARGHGMANEYKAKGVNILLGPVVGPLGRTVSGGRIWESFSIDPYLAGALVYETVTGIQSTGVGASTKHFIGNEQETDRKPVETDNGNVTAVSSNIDDKTMHELYLWPFQDAVLAGTTNIMCSYQRVNNSYGCQNSKTLNGLLKTELGFQGFVVTDWDAIHGGVASALAGLDVAMPNDAGFWGDSLVQAVKNGSVPESRVTDMATSHTNLLTDEAAMEKKTLYAGAVEGHVLVKNNGALPLAKPKLLSVFGFSAKSPDLNNFGGQGGLGYAAYDFNGVTEAQPESFYRPEAINGTLYSGGGSGATSQSLVISRMDALMQRAWDDDTGIFWDLSSSFPTVNGASDACIVMVNLYASEGFDRPAIHSDYSSTLTENVARNCLNTIVVIHNAGPALFPPWIDNANVTAVVLAHLPGQYSGRALIDLLYGKENFSGKLPYTVASNESDYGDLFKPDRTEEGPLTLFPQSNFTEGVFVDYRRFDAMNITPRYEFGFGLSYTKFEYSNLQISTSIKNASMWPTGPILEGGHKDLWDVLVTVRADVTNAGSVDGAEVAQLYLAMPSSGDSDAPVKQLRGFDKKVLTAGSTSTYEFSLTRRDLSIWDTVAQKWKLEAGSYKLMVGGSSKSLSLDDAFIITN